MLMSSSFTGTGPPKVAGVGGLALDIQFKEYVVLRRRAQDVARQYAVPLGQYSLREVGVAGGRAALMGESHDPLTVHALAHGFHLSRRRGPHRVTRLAGQFRVGSLLRPGMDGFAAHRGKVQIVLP